MLAGVTADTLGTVQIAAGVVGPRVTPQGATHGVVPDPFAGAIHIELDIRWDDDQHRYVCQEFHAYGDPSRAVGVTTDVLRRVRIADWVTLTLLFGGDGGGGVIREEPNPDGREPWGLKPPDGVAEALAEAGPNDRAMRWTAHLYTIGHAVGYGGTKNVEEVLKLTRATAGRWVGWAREAGYLSPAPGAGKAGI
jgi:hypothetical protein